MLPIKLVKTGFSVALLLSLLLSSSCTFYKTVQVNPISSASIDSVYQSRSTMIIHDDRENMEYILRHIVFESDSLKGVLELSPPGRRHSDHKKSFLRKNVRPYRPLKVVHLYSSTQSFEPGEFAMAIDDIRFVEIHKKSKGKSILVTMGIVVVASGAAVGSYYAIVLIGFAGVL